MTNHARCPQQAESQYNGKKRGRISGPGSSKDNSKQKKADRQNSRTASENAPLEEVDPDTARAPKCTILSVAEGQAFLEEEAFIDLDEGLDLDVMVGALIQILLTKGMPVAAGYAVRSVALILAQMKIDSVSEALVSAMETKIEGMLAKTAERTLRSMKELADVTTAELKAASTDVATSATQIVVTTTSYRDALKSIPNPNPSPGPTAGACALDICIRAREGIKARQILVDAQIPGKELLPGVSNNGLAEAANSAVRNMDGGAIHSFVSAKRLSNGGILLEMNSKGAASWLGRPDVKPAFLERFAVDAMVKNCAFPLVVQFVPFTFRPDFEAELRRVEVDNGMEADSILHARWIKPPHRRSQSQTCGHIILVISKPAIANRILTDRLLICQKCVYAEKCKKGAHEMSEVPWLGSPVI